MQNGAADPSGKRWRPNAAKQRSKVAQRAAILLAAVALLVIGAKVCYSPGAVLWSWRLCSCFYRTLEQRHAQHRGW